jgi:hypothetical protein
MVEERITDLGLLYECKEAEVEDLPEVLKVRYHCTRKPRP